ncbi:MAG: bifunctional methylenetetrahydrofolate dehydrogenase/methenyltetrahydrofolate cyclohydrolase FolD [Gammaproteobacteria bacterium CG_4_10_14_0_8_um_filter_38_16]|nr:MAG: bifunctional methylenetetrahydrofolate dehydrogenase/methenyltetrahydrofolate cyclohydrolase FolD [Gammaproteobacteria bacterium CG_4_10_14_0_8_um_filter_38_16]PJA02949.1 MAG: bifunctional methylenetetrahydrofolate dehydrogenase/methenyltetrahydrofolate cyclohydrolase FolD [Gammaproteobacteria bacterium CG_4_10_14_0_2_um_filter_38_22]PJB11384.1 MAG: bifunctional methylenetetrahydrofolate dehydrogenase/methenyltetrahydrofolate cyclohydrolase FolD [Gammaproteobacteria bacterium CG_4_9_14_3_
MTAHILDGRSIAAKIKAEIADAVRARKKNNLSTPGLAVILVGHNPASQTYVKHKRQACDEAGIYSECHEIPENTDQSTLEKLILTLNQNNQIHGILLQLPLPAHLNADALLEKIDPKKDVDGFHPYNLGRLAQKRPLLRPCTPHGVMTLLKATGENLTGKNAVVVGASNIVGRPMALELLLAKCTVTVCHRDTHDLQHFISQADILISATGHHGIINSDWIKPGAIVIDVGFSRLSNGKISGDIDFDTAKKYASWITPVPGGVGPMTVATLLQNTLMATTLS